MIHITSYPDAITVKGHAANPAEGQIPTKRSAEACAAITALTQTLLFSADEDLDERPKGAEISPGFFVFPTRKASAELNILIAAFNTGARYIADAYSDYITYTSYR